MSVYRVVWLLGLALAPAGAFHPAAALPPPHRARAAVPHGLRPGQPRLLLCNDPTCPTCRATDELLGGAAQMA